MGGSGRPGGAGAPLEGRTSRGGSRGPGGAADAALEVRRWRRARLDFGAV